MKKFIILSSQRSGSTYLQMLLNSHPDIFAGGEIFNNNPRHPIEIENITQSLVDIKDSDPEKYLNHYFLHSTERPVNCIGFRLFYDHGRGRREVIWSVLKNIPDFRIIHLQRKNQLKQFVSLKLAETTSHWLRRASEKPFEYEPIPLDIRECKRYFRRQQRKKERAVLFFDNTERLDIFYEDLAEDPKSETGRVLSFLGLNPAELSCDIGKQNFQSLTKTIANYHELKNQLKDTDWEYYFED